MTTSCGCERLDTRRLLRMLWSRTRNQITSNSRSEERRKIPHFPPALVPRCRCLSHIVECRFSQFLYFCTPLVYDDGRSAACSEPAVAAGLQVLGAVLR